MANRDEMSFSRAFADARRELGAGKTFTWRGNSYTTNLAEEAPRRGGRTGPATENAPEASPRPTSRRSVGEKIPSRRDSLDRELRRSRSMGTFSEEGTVEGEGQRARPGSRSTPTRTQAAPERSMGRFSERGTVEGEGQRARPGSLQRAIDSAPNAAARTEAQRIADEGLRRRMPLRSLINSVLEGIATRRENATSSRAASRTEAAESAAAGRRAGAQAGRERRAAGMARGGMVKKGNTDRRGKGMFYDSKSPRGYK